MKQVAIIMGSDSDFPVLRPAVQLLREFGVPITVRVLSAHRTPDAAAAFAKRAEAEQIAVIIAAAGKAAHLAGAMAAHFALPVIGVPVQSSALDGMDALLSTVQMPPGIPVATVGIDGGKNAALLAVQMLAIGDAQLRAKLEKYRARMAQQVMEKDAALQASLEAQ